MVAAVQGSRLQRQWGWKEALSYVLASVPFPWDNQCPPFLHRNWQQMPRGNSEVAHKFTEVRCGQKQPCRDQLPLDLNSSVPFPLQNSGMMGLQCGKTSFFHWYFFPSIYEKPKSEDLPVEWQQRGVSTVVCYVCNSLPSLLSNRACLWSDSHYTVPDRIANAVHKPQNRY